MDAITNTIIEDTIVDVKFSGVSWKANEGSTIPVMTNQKEEELSAKPTNINCTKLGTAQKTIK
jgi:prolyl oligopeptidase